MDTEGLFVPETASGARERYEALGPAAQVVVRETARAIELDAEAYRERVTADVIETARDALFASTLRVRVGTREEFEAWRDDHPAEVVEQGSPNVDNVVWHHAPFAGTVVAATYHEQRRAAVDTLRRQAFGRIYRDVLEGD